MGPKSFKGPRKTLVASVTLFIGSYILLLAKYSYSRCVENRLRFSRCMLPRQAGARSGVMFHIEIDTICSHYHYSSRTRRANFNSVIFKVKTPDEHSLQKWDNTVHQDASTAVTNGAVWKIAFAARTTALEVQDCALERRQRTHNSTQSRFAIKLNPSIPSQ